MAERALITGIAGQDGSYLAELLLARGDEVAGLDRPAAFASPNLDGVRGRVHRGRGRPARPRLAARRRRARRSRPRSTTSPRRRSSPTRGRTRRRRSRRSPARPRRCSPPRSPPTRARACGCRRRARSSATRRRARRTRARRCARARRTASRSSPRTASCSTMRAHHGLFACSGITYNHESPRRPPHFLPRKVTRGAAAIALGLERSSCSGTWSAVRDWSDARDIMRGAVLALGAHEPGDYVLASGTGRTVARARRDGAERRRRRGRRRALGARRPRVRAAARARAARREHAPRAGGARLGAGDPASSG